MKNEYAAVWDQLEKEASQNNGPHALVRRIIPQSSLDVFIGIESPDNRRMFTLEVATASLDKMDDLPVFKGLEITKRPSTTNKPGKSSLYVILRGARFADLFSVLVEDVATELISIQDEDKALSLTISRLVEWQQFTEQGDRDGLTAYIRRGLYAELYLTMNHLIPQAGSRAIFFWKGFTATQQDYYLGKSAVEVKATMAKQHQKLVISSERQLDDEHLDRLFLYHLSLDEIQDSTNTLPGIIGRIREAIKEDARAREYFEDGLFQLGYHDEHATMYKNLGYEIREENLFAVEGDFPRILEKDVKPGVGDVVYSISVAECKHYPADLSILKDLAKENGDGK